MRCRIELTFHVATRMCEVCQIEKLVPQPQDAVALGLSTRNEAPIKSYDRRISLNDEIVLCFRMVDLEFVLEAGAAAALD